MAEVEELLYRVDMPEILDNWVLKLVLESEEDLSPTRMVRVCEYPPLIVLGFDDEDTKPGNQNVVDLSRSIINLESDVIQQVVVGSAKVLLREAGESPFTVILG